MVSQWLCKGFGGGGALMVRGRKCQVEGLVSRYRWPGGMVDWSVGRHRVYRCATTRVLGCLGFQWVENRGGYG